MAPAIAAALSLATKYLPDVVGLLTDNKRAGKTAQIVSEAVKQVTGSTTLQGADEAFQNSPELVLELRKAVMADKYVAEEMRLKDVQDARAMYKEENTQADKLSDLVMKWNLVIILCLVAINVLAILYLTTNATVLALISNLVGVVVGALLGERQQVTGFYFGSSLGSKNKDKERQKEKGL